MVQSRAIGVNIATVLAKVEKDLEDVRNQFLTEVANDLVLSSPIWSGQYITSHSISASSSAGQFTSNVGGWSEKTNNPQAYIAESRANLLGDIAALPAKADKIYINNNAPHARIVEDGGVRTEARHVFRDVSGRAGYHLQEAINKVRGSQ